MRAYVTVVCIIGLAAPIAMAAPQLMVVTAFTGIGIPVAVLLAVAPTLALYLIPAFLIWRLAARAPGLSSVAQGFPGWLIPILILVAAGWLISNPSYRKVNARLDALVAGDIALSEKPALSGTIAFLSEERSTACTDFCQRLLLSGTATRVLLTDKNDRSALPDDRVAATSWHMERRAVCPEVKLDTNDGTLTIAEEARDAFAPMPVDLMAQQIAAGNCLVEGEATIADADAIIQLQRVEPAPGKPVRDGILTAQRSALFLRRDSGLVEAYRHTAARGYAITAPVFITWAGGYGFDPGKAGPARAPLYRNAAGRFEIGPDLATLAVETLGLSLAVVKPDSRDSLAAQITGFLANAAPLNDAQNAVIDAYFQRFGFNDPVLAADQATILTILSDPRTLLPTQASNAVPSTEDAAPAFFLALADAAFQRAKPPGNPPPGPKSRDHFSALAGIISQLPAAALASHKDDLIRIARDPALRVPMWQALIRLGGFGADGAAELVRLVDTADQGADGSYGNSWQHPYLAGMIGLCLMGPDAAGTGEQLLALLDQGKVKIGSGPYGRLTTSTFARLGLPKDRLTALWPQEGEKPDLSDLDRGYTQGDSPKGCHF